MLNKKLQADHWNEMCYQLLKLMTKQLKSPEVFECILLVKIKLLIKKLEDSKDEYQVTLARLLSNKLAKRYYRPFEVLERVGKVAYRLSLPLTSKIHLVFHVLILKPFSRTGHEIVANLPEEDHDGHPMEKPPVICATRVVLQNEESGHQVLVQWLIISPEEAT
ncbi:hypothetical protein Tco_0843098 [Tanacetum coccineum]|uniref:Tf2-1-like SH3-like domain-containing protein n=1 Tax=Tanacetum coccineum TaxID=301880 RepID=A0ABQ5B204_9ASTR